MSYWIQLSTHRLASQTVYRAQVLEGTLPIASTVNAWPENAGCGKAAAIGEARAIVAALEWQQWCQAEIDTWHPKSLNPASLQPINASVSKWAMWAIAAGYILITIAIVAK